jgi:hypothetical protein
MAGASPEFAWADNVVKCERARAAAGKNATEKEVFDLYVKFAGKVIGSGPVEAAVEEAVEVSPAKKVKKAK